MRSAAAAPAALVLVWMLPAAAQDIPADAAAQLPIPRAALQDPDADEMGAAESMTASPDAVVFNPALAAIGRANAASGAHLRARAPIPVDIIRKGFAARQTMASAQQDRSVGFKLGQDVFSLSTSLTTPAQQGASRDARLDWRWAQPVSKGPGLIWGLSTGGSGTVGGNPEQTGDAMIGYRQQVFPHLTLTTQLGMAGNYVFAAGDGFHSALTPEVKLSVDLARMADLPWQASLDLALARKLPLVASDYETRGTALISLKYKWQ
jgi:hypothetical protein